MGAHELQTLVPCELKSVCITDPCLPQVHYLDEPVSDYVRCAADTAMSIHRDGMPGDILLLLPGELILGCCLHGISVPISCRDL